MFKYGQQDRSPKFSTSFPYHTHRTEKTQSPSFTKNFLSTHNHPVVKSIAKAREINKAHTTFIDTILKHQL